MRGICVKGFLVLFSVLVKYGWLLLTKLNNYNPCFLNQASELHKISHDSKN